MMVMVVSSICRFMASQVLAAARALTYPGSLPHPRNRGFGSSSRRAVPSAGNAVDGTKRQVTDITAINKQLAGASK